MKRATRPHLVLSGELGSGKSTVAGLLAEELDLLRLSTGAVQRQIAEQRGVSTLQLNRQSESDRTIDDEIDSVFRSLATDTRPHVVDSRLAWHFLPDAFAVHLVVDAEDAAERVARREAGDVERYTSTEEARTMIAERVASERKRFLALYDVDIFDLRNYDLVVDTSIASPEEVTAGIITAYRAAASGGRPQQPPPALLLAPTRIHPATDDPSHTDAPAPELITVSYRRPSFVLVAGADLLERAVKDGDTLVPARLVETASDQ